MKLEDEQYLSGYIAGYGKLPYQVWETDIWREAWLKGTCARVGHGLQVHKALKEMGLKPGIKEG